MPDFLLGFAAFYQMIYVLLLSHFSRVRLRVAHQAPLSTGFSRQEYWSQLPFPSPNDIYACDQNNFWILNNNKTAIMWLTKLPKHPQAFWFPQCYETFLNYTLNPMSLVVFLNISVFSTQCHSGMSKSWQLLDFWHYEQMNQSFLDLSLIWERTERFSDRYYGASLVVQMVKKSACNVGDLLGSIPWSGRSPEEGNVYPLQNSFLKNSMDGGTWQATVHEIAE